MFTFIFQKTVKDLFSGVLLHTILHYINLTANHCHQNKATPCYNQVFIFDDETVVFWNFRKKFWFVLKKSCGCWLRGFYLVLHYVYGFFFGGILLIFSVLRLFVYDVHKEQRGGRIRGKKFWTSLLMVVHGFWGRCFLSAVICRYFSRLVRFTV